MRRYTLFNNPMPAVAALAVLLSACGGGGGGGTDSGGGGGGAPIVAPAANVQPVTIDAGPIGNSTNVLFTSVILCVPGTSACQTIDHVVVDTGSSGLRIISSVLRPSLLSALPAVFSGGFPIAECTHFADGSAWGPLKVADVKISGEVAASVPIQVIGDPAFTEPSDCQQSGPPENTVAQFGANGIVGVGEFLQDCGLICEKPGSGFYYTCTGAGNTISCNDTGLFANLQVANPLALFANDNNGVIIELPAINTAGAATVSGALVFGIGTQANNGLGSAQVIQTVPATGYFTTVYNARQFTFSLLDSGSSAYFFDSAITVCTSQNLPQSIALGYYCPQSPLSLSAVIQGTNNNAVNVPFSVGNAFSLFSAHPTYTAFNDIGVPQPQVFIWGLPAFFGRPVYVAFEGHNTSAGPGPYFAF
jgi:hypothetical protein